MSVADSELTPARFFKRAAFRFFECLLQEPEGEMPEMVTPGGERVEPTTVTFSIRDVAAVVDALDESYGEDEEEEDWVITEADEEGTLHEHGRISIEADKLFLDTWARARADEERDHLEDLCAGNLRHLETRTTSLEQYVEETRSEEDDESHVHTTEEVEAAVRAIDAHYHRWIDDSIPALQGRTPREVAGDDLLTRLVPRLVQLLKDLENREAHAPAVEGHPYDFGWIWNELGLERPVTRRP